MSALVERPELVPEPSPGAARWSRPRVLLVAADEGLVRLAEDFLGGSGYVVVGGVASAAEALAHCRREPPAVVLVDLGLVGELGAVELALRVRREAEVPVVLLSPTAGALTAEQAERSPFPFVVGPFSSEPLVAAVERARAEHARERGQRDAELSVSPVLGAVGDGVITVLADGLVSSANASAVRLLGDGVMAGASLIAALAELPGWPAELASAITMLARGDGPALTTTPLTVCRSKGPACEVEVTAYPLPAANGRDGGAILVVKEVTERNQRMRELHASQQRYRDLFTHSRQAILLTAGSGSIVDLNQAAEELLGFRRERLVGTSIAALFVDRKVWEEYRRQATTAGGCTDLEARLRRASGQVRLCLLTMSVRPGSDGAPPEHQCIVHDVTDRRLLLESLRSFKLAVDSTQIGVTITDLERRITFVNRAEAEMHGYAPEELLGHHAGILGGGGQRQHPGGLAFGEATRWQRETVNHRRDGSTFPVQLYSDVVRDEGGQPVAVVTLCEDVSERLAAVERIRRLSHAVEQSPALVIITDTEGRVEYVNPQFTATTGYRPEEVLGRSTNLLKSGEMAPEVYRELWATISAGGTWRGEFLNRKKDGSLYWALASISGLANEQGRITSYVGIQEDITLRKQMEEQLAAKNEDLERLNRLKSDMMAIASHDIRSPLNAIISLASLLRDAGRGLGPAATLGTVEQIIASGMKLSSFVTDILDVEKIDSGRLTLNPTRLALEQVVSACVGTARGEGMGKGLTVSFRVEGTPDPVAGDPMRLEQVIGNLLSNAVKFSPAGGTVEVVLADAGDACLVTVADQGPGVPEADRERIFDRYYQVSSDGRVAERGFGIGLGLYITRKLVTLHGGTVAVDNLASGGCRFSVRLPTCARPRTEAELCVLVVDAGHSTGHWLRDLLSERGVLVATASTAAVARSLVAGQRPHLVVVATAGIEAELAELVAVARGGRCPALVVVVSAAAAEPPAVAVDASLSLPLAASEVYAILRRTLLAAQRGVQP